MSIVANAEAIARRAQARDTAELALLCLLAGPAIFAVGFWLLAEAFWEWARG